MRIAIIGGGASGMMAALTASARGQVTLLERNPRLGKKLALTGNGRCNLTNVNMAPEHYHGGRDFAAAVIARFGPGETLSYFRRLGLLTVKEPSGRVYPHSDQAGSVVDVLRLAVAAAGVEIRTDFEVSRVDAGPSGFVLRSKDNSLRAHKLIVACGGAAGTRAGGVGLGYDILSSLGHSVTPLRPALVQLKTENSFTRPLKGVRADAGVRVTDRGAIAAESAGEVQFTEYGLSGPAIFEVSREAAAGSQVHLDLLREVSPRELRELIMSRVSSPVTLENLLTGLLHNKLGRTVLTSCGLSLTAPASSLRDGDVELILRRIKDTVINVTGNLGFDGAQVTAGGADTREFRPETLESRIVPGLYACGEVLDVDGDCGGYNLQWAWSSGHLAGELR